MLNLVDPFGIHFSHNSALVLKDRERKEVSAKRFSCLHAAKTEGDKPLNDT